MTDSRHTFQLAGNTVVRRLRVHRRRDPLARIRLRVPAWNPHTAGRRCPHQAVQGV